MITVKLDKVGFKKDGLFGYVDGKRVWLNCVGIQGQFTGKQVKDLISKKYKTGDDVPVEVEKGSDGTLGITKVVLQGQQQTQQQETQAQKQSEPVQQTEKKTTYSPKGNYSSSDNAEGMRRGAVLHAVSRSLIALQGQVNAENIFEVAQRLYDFYYYSEPTPRG